MIVISRKLFAIPLLAVLFLPLFTVSAQTVSTTTPSDTQALIQQLQELVNSLKVQIEELRAKLETQEKELEVVKSEIQFSTFLSRGSTGDEVRQVQEVLKTDPEIYPEGLVTGFFGLLTEAAVRRFQEKHGIEAVGIVGPKTRAKLQELATQGVGASRVIPPGFLIAPGISTTTQAITTPEEKVIICHYPSGNPENKQTIEVDQLALNAHLAHRDTMGACGIPPVPPPPPPSPTATTTATTTPTTPPPAPTPTPSPTPSPAPSPTPSPTAPPPPPPSTSTTTATTTASTPPPPPPPPPPEPPPPPPPTSTQKWQITTVTSLKDDVHISSNKIVWSDYRNGNQPDLYLYDISAGQEQQLTKDAASEFSPDIDGDNVAYRFGSEVYVYNLSSGSATKITSANISRAAVLSISGNKVVTLCTPPGSPYWVPCVADASAGQELYLQNCTSTSCIAGSPNISGNIVVWNESQGGLWKIKYHDLSTGVTQTISGGIADKFYPFIDGNRIVYFGRSSSGASTGAVYMYDLNSLTEKKISSKTSLDVNASPVMSGKWIAWLDTLGYTYDLDNDYYIYNLDTGVETKIVSGASPYGNFDISGDYFVWTDEKQVYLYNLSQLTASSLELTSSLASLLQSIGIALNDIQKEISKLVR